MSSSEENASQYLTASEDDVVGMCHRLLKKRDFKGARHIIRMNQSMCNKLHQELEKVLVICDILIAAENRLPHGLLDCYGILKMVGPGPLKSEYIMKVMDLLEWGDTVNTFPFTQEATEKAYLAWSLLYNPINKAIYDYAISDEDNLETKGNVPEYRGVNVNKRGDDGGLCEEVIHTEKVQKMCQPMLNVIYAQK
ncbi:hypothetical protein CARUB_v10002694mg, partial [Capsella rubella]